MANDWLIKLKNQPKNKKKMITVNGQVNIRKNQNYQVLISF